MGDLPNVHATCSFHYIESLAKCYIQEISDESVSIATLSDHIERHVTSNGIKYSKNELTYSAIRKSGVVYHQHI